MPVCIGKVVSQNGAEVSNLQDRLMRVTERFFRTNITVNAVQTWKVAPREKSPPANLRLTSGRFRLTRTAIPPPATMAPMILERMFSPVSERTSALTCI